MLEDRAYMRESSPYGPQRSATVILLIVNAVAFVLQLTCVFYLRFDVFRYFALSVDGLRHGFYWQLLTYQLMHGGWLHLILNCITIYFFGRELEHALGRKRFLLLYFGAGVLGGLLQAGAGFVIPRFAGQVVGASAGAFGLVAAFASLYPERMLTMLVFFVIPVSMRAKYLLLIASIMTLIGIAFPMDNYAHLAHLGGLIAGMAFIKHGLNWQLPTFRRPIRRPSARLVRAGVGGRSNPPWSSAEDLTPDEFLSKEVDPILDKISSQGIQSLTERERKILEQARQRMGKR